MSEEASSVFSQGTAMGNKKAKSKSKQNENNSLVKPEEHPSEIVLLYCESEFCDGEPIEAIPIKGEKEFECPICCRSLKSERLAILDTCIHAFCQKCIASWRDREKKCPMCRKKFNWTMFVSSRIQPKHVEITLSKHRFCCLRNPILLSYFKSLNEHWLKFLRFMHIAPICDDVYVGVRGTEIINLLKYEKEGCIISKEKSFVILKSEGHIQAIFCCLLPNLSIRLVISDEEIDFETDSAAADEVVECLNKQLEACWYVLPKLLGPTIYRVFIRKFENVSCSLVLCGNNDYYEEQLHCEPMKEQLGKMKEYNFDSSLVRQRRNKLPSLVLINLKISDRSKTAKCCSPEIQ